jgi:hypothetical protein
MFAFLNRPVDVGAQDDPIVHGDRQVPIDVHIVRDNALLSHVLSHFFLPTENLIFTRRIIKGTGLFYQNNA